MTRCRIGVGSELAIFDPTCSNRPRRVALSISVTSQPSAGVAGARLPIVRWSARAAPGVTRARGAQSARREATEAECFGSGPCRALARPNSPTRAIAPTATSAHNTAPRPRHFLVASISVPRCPRSPRIVTGSTCSRDSKRPEEPQRRNAVAGQWLKTVSGGVWATCGL